jgi:hypothetical protein
MHGSGTGIGHGGFHQSTIHSFDNGLDGFGTGQLPDNQSRERNKEEYDGGFFMYLHVLSFANLFNSMQEAQVKQNRTYRRY